MRRFPLRRGLLSALLGAGLPYGYTVTTFASGQVVVRAHGTPGLTFVLLFAGGAVAAFGVLRWTVRGDAAAAQLPASPHLVRAGAVHAMAVAGAICAAALLARLPEVPAWAAAPFAATLVYLTVVSIELALMEGARADEEDAGEGA